MLADGVVHLNPASAVFEPMLEGWATQQRARFLKANTIGLRLDLVRRFAAFTSQHSWQWESAEAEVFITRPCSMRLTGGWKRSGPAAGRERWRRSVTRRC
jgi:hypothetical protein